MPLNGVRRMRANAKAVGSIVKSKIRGKIADRKRAQLLFNQGYGEYRASAKEILKAGKSGGKKRIGRTSIKRK
jgi:hypothetical protein